LLTGAAHCIAVMLLSFGWLAAQGSGTQFQEELASLVTPTGTLYGTMTLPAKCSRCPVVFIIAGSGPTDRNGNTPLLPGANNTYKLLAEELAKNGIASLRTDKRGIAESKAALKSELDITFDTYIDDAVLWLRQLRGDKRFSTITVAGHSEGSLIGMVAAARVSADGYISLAGAGERIDKILLRQLKPQLTPELYAAAEKDLAILASGQTFKDVPPQLMSLFRPSIQPYMISWIRHDPAVEIAKLNIPVLIIQGKTDTQVTVADAESLAKAYPKAKLVLIDNINHMLKEAGTDKDSQMKAYTDPTLPVSPTVTKELVSFVQGLKKKS